MTSTLLIAFDVECTGGNLAKHALVEIGAVAGFFVPGEDKRKRVPIEIERTFETTMAIPEGREWEEKCVREFWENPSRPEYEALKAKKAAIDRCEISPESGMKQFVSWVRWTVDTLVKGDASRMRFVSDNAAYDAAWIGVYLGQYANHEPLTTFFDGRFQAVVDTSSYHQGLSRIDHAREREIKREKGKYSEDRECRAILGIPDDVKPTAVHDHRAVHDAQEILEQHVIILGYMLQERKHSVQQTCGNVSGVGTVGNSFGKF